LTSSTPGNGAGRLPTPYLEDGAVPADNNWFENQIRPIAIRRNRNRCLFAPSQRAAAAMRLIHSCQLSGQDGYLYPKTSRRGCRPNRPAVSANRGRTTGSLLPEFRNDTSGRQ
jgi:hypothetical protein